VGVMAKLSEKDFNNFLKDLGGDRYSHVSVDEAARAKKAFDKEMLEERWTMYEESIFTGDCSKLNKLRSDKEMLEERWTMYDVVMIDKDELEPVIDTSVIAKNSDHAKGKAGVLDKLKEKDFDDTKFVVKVVKIAFIRPVEDDE
jgi:hypothetical protein